MNQGWTRHEIRVRYQETDQMGIVYHTNYLNWFEIGRTEWIRAMGITYKELELRNLLLPLTDAEIKFRLPARYDEELTIYTKLSEYSNVRVTFSSEIRRHTNLGQTDETCRSIMVPEPSGELLVSGCTRHVWVNRAWKAVRIDKEAPDLYQIMRGNTEES